MHIHIAFNPFLQVALFVEGVNDFALSSTKSMSSMSLLKSSQVSVFKSISPLDTEPQRPVLSDDSKFMHM